MNSTGRLLLRSPDVRRWRGGGSRGEREEVEERGRERKRGERDGEESGREGEEEGRQQRS